MKNNIIVCKELTGGGEDALDGVDHLDIYGDGSDNPVVEGDIAFVITTSGVSYIYKAVEDLVPATSGTLVVAMVSGGLISWRRQLKADKTTASALPTTEIMETTDDTVPTGYSDFAYFYGGRESLIQSGTYSTTVFPMVALYSGTFFSIYDAPSTEASFKLVLSTGALTSIGNVPLNTQYPCGAQYTDNLYYIFNPYDNTAATLDLTDDSWTVLTEAFPGNSTVEGACACACNGKIYICGGYYNTGTTDIATNWEYNTVADTYASKLDAPSAFSYAGAVAVGNLIHYMYNDSGTTIKVLIYDTVNNTWDNSSIPSFDFVLDDDPRFSVFYDSVRGEVGWVGESDKSGAQMVIGYDTTLEVWEILTSFGYSGNDASSFLWDSANDRWIATTNDGDIYSYPRTGQYLCSKD